MWLQKSREQAKAMMDEYEQKFKTVESIYDVLGAELAELG
jgi:hypothetical protein